MERLPEDEIFEFNDGALEEIRSKYDLSGPGRMKEAIQILQEWIEKQPHFKKKDFLPSFLESTLISRKGSIERTKRTIDKLCTMRTLMPQYFMDLNFARDVVYLQRFVLQALLPKPTNENCRLGVIKCVQTGFSRTDYFNYAKYCIAICDYWKTFDYTDGISLIFDFYKANIVDVCLQMDLVVTKEVLSIFFEGYGVRLKGLHFICESSFISTLLNLIKPMLGPKLSQRIFVHNTITELYNYVDRKLLTKELGGDQPSIQELHDLWINVLSSEKKIKHYEEMSGFCTDETYRREDNFNDQYAGMAGTFRVLKVD